MPCYIEDAAWKYARDKSAFKKKCREIGIPIVDEYTVSATPLPEELAVIEYPVVVKPVDGTGNRGFYPAEAQQRRRILLLPRRVQKFQPLRVRMQQRLMWDPQKRARRRVRPKPQIQLIQKEKRWKRLGISTSSIPATFTAA